MTVCSGRKWREIFTSLSDMWQRDLFFGSKWIYIFYSLHLRFKQNTPYNKHNSHHDVRAKAFFEILTPHLVKTKWIFVRYTATWAEHSCWSWFFSAQLSLIFNINNVIYDSPVPLITLPHHAAPWSIGGFVLVSRAVLVIINGSS